MRSNEEEYFYKQNQELIAKHRAKQDQIRQKQEAEQQKAMSQTGQTQGPTPEQLREMIARLEQMDADQLAEMMRQMAEQMASGQQGQGGVTAGMLMFGLQGGGMPMAMMPGQRGQNGEGEGGGQGGQGQGEGSGSGSGEGQGGNSGEGEDSLGRARWANTQSTK